MKLNLYTVSGKTALTSDSALGKALNGSNGSTLARTASGKTFVLVSDAIAARLRAASDIVAPANRNDEAFEMALKAQNEAEARGDTELLEAAKLAELHATAAAKAEGFTGTELADIRRVIRA